MPAPNLLFLVTVIAYCLCSVDSRAVVFRLPDAVLSEETPHEKFHRSDGDKDGKLTLDEYLSMELPYVLMKKTEFMGFDADGDGFITRKEYRHNLDTHHDKYDASRAHYFGEIYADYDENFDMMLEENEVIAMINSRFNLKPGKKFHDTFLKFDENKDGGLDIDEYIKFDDNMPLDEFVPDTSRPAGSRPRPTVHCDGEETEDKSEDKSKEAAPSGKH